tara:strand:- start:602 stop:874 length:273 start_codon:yes stop_codon:yes gene_type:complete
MSHIHKKTENDKISSNNSISRKQGLNTTTADQKAIIADQKAIIASLNPTTEKKKQTKRKKTLRSGNAFIRPPKQNLLIMRYSEPVILRFD